VGPSRYTRELMRNWLKLAALVLVGLGVAQVLKANGASGSGASPENREAPSFDLPGLDGTTLGLSALRGKVVAVNFWATWCAPCNEELPALAQAWREVRGRCQEIVGVTEESAPDDVAATVKRFAIPYPVLLDKRGEVARTFGVTEFPRTYIVDPDGRVRKVFRGAVQRARLLEAMAEFLPPGCTGS